MIIPFNGAIIIARDVLARSHEIRIINFFQIKLYIIQPR